MSIMGARITVPTIAAMPPIVLMTPFASDRYAPGIVSGMSATTGPRAACFAEFSRNSTTMSTTSVVPAAKGIAPKNTAESGSVTRMYGIRRPIRVLVLSDMCDTIGMRKSANMLSSVMMRPTSEFRSRKSRRKTGTYAS